MENKNLYEKYKNSTQKELERELINACANNKVKIVEYLLTSPDLNTYADIHANGDYGLCSACRKGNKKIVEYLLFCPELKEHANIHAEEDLPFRWSYQFDQMHLIKYFIFDLNIKKSLSIKKYLKKYPDEEIENMFKIRDLNKNLNNKLDSSNITTNKLKV